jgi:SAM-dependent methyltransferase
VSCPACGAGAVAPRPLSVREFLFHRCASCRSLYCDEGQESTDTSALYADSSYFMNPEFESPDSGGYHGYKDYLADRERIERKFGTVLAHIERLHPPGKLLDVGAGPGFLVSEARRRGWDALGIDLNPWAEQFARDRVGVDVRCAALGDAGFEDASFDAVTAMDLIEHVPDPNPLLAEVARVLRVGGGLALLTPDAGSPVSRMLGARWPEVQRVPEHLILYSVEGLAQLLERHGFRAVGWHSIGKESELRTLVADVSPAAPAIGGAVASLVDRYGVGDHVVDLDPRTKFCLYAVRSETSVSRRFGTLPRLPKAAPEPLAREAVFDDLNALAAAPGLIRWMFDQYRAAVHGRVAEIGAGIGTFSALMLEAGADEALLIEPDEACAKVLEERFSGEDRVEVSRDMLPDAPRLTSDGEGFDFIVCQNVLEHVHEDLAGLESMRAALKPGGSLTLLVPAHPRLYGALDEAYGHYRRYTSEGMRELIRSAGLDLESLYSFNLLGVPGWWAKNRTRSPRIGAGPLKVYEAALRAWRPLEERIHPKLGLSLIAHAHRPAETPS